MLYKIDKKVHIKSDNGKPSAVVAVTQRSSNPSEWIEVISLGELGAELLWRVSNDSGQTWKSFEPVGTPPARQSIEGTKVISHWQTGLFRDEQNDLLIAGWLRNSRDESIVSHLDNEGISSRKMYYQISRNGGKNWGELYPIIEGEYDKGNWPDGIGCYGGMVDFNQGCILNDGALLCPTWKFRYFPETDSIAEKDTGMWWLAVGALRGEWKYDNSGIDGEFSSWLTLNRDKSCRGLCEPTMVELKDGRVLAVMRAGKPVDSDFSGVKFYSVSEDGGRTWSEPEVLTYEDGSPMYSPSSMVQVLRWNACNGIYLITNILDRDDIIRGCDPRYPIQIARLNEDIMSPATGYRIVTETGIQFMQINTIYQLYSFTKKKPQILENTKYFLTIPDLLNYWLTGIIKNEYSIATTTQLYNPVKKNWSKKILNKLGLKTKIFGEMSMPGTKIGKLLPAIA